MYINDTTIFINVETETLRKILINQKEELDQNKNKLLVKFEEL